jgi:hypothetical protein
MEHLRFKSSQTPAAYVAGALDSRMQEAFELHLMSCPQCVDEVEAWRTIKDKMVDETGERSREPELAAAPAAAATHRSALMGWRLAASLAAICCAGAAAGWYARSAQGPSIDADNLGFYSLPVRMRGPADCLSLRLDAPIKLVAVRVPGAAPEQQLVAVDGAGRDLSPDSYSVRTQSDGSWLVRLSAASIRGQGVRFEARSADGTADPRGCVFNSAKG